MSEQHLSDRNFESLGLPEPLVRGIHEAGFRLCTPIQAATLPHALAGRDVAGQAQTGTGKTAAFLLALFNRLLQQPASAQRRHNQPRAAVFAPTRELAIQIHKDAEALGKYTGLSLGLVYGGLGYDTQRKMLEDGVDVLIGTPGRVIDYFKQQVFDFKAVQVVVIDEADRMFDLGFIRDIRFLLRRMPPPHERLGMLFSATLSFRVNELAYEHMNNPVLVKIEPQRVTVENVTEVLYHVSIREKLPLLVGLLQRHQPTRSLVFTNTKGAAERVQASLLANGYRAAVLSGDVPQKKRQRLLQEFQEGKFPMLVATDVAARGLHIPAVSHVFNFDLPQDPEDYVHRIGRTARAGASGHAISLACEEYVFSMTDIENFIGHKIPVERFAEDMLPVLQPAERQAQEDRRGERQRDRRPPRRGDRRPRREGAAARPSRSARLDRPERPKPPAPSHVPAPESAAPPSPQPVQTERARGKLNPRPPARRRDLDKPIIG